jgi:serine/threonine-protein kinase
LVPDELLVRSSELPAVSSDRYFQLGELGRGGMGRVTVVFDRVLGRDVARKEVLDERTTALLVAEAQVCAQLEHPSIVPVYDLSTAADGSPNYTMRVVRGRCLGEILVDPERPPLAQLLGVLRQVCLVVDYAHSRGVVHRDLKPDNILVGAFGEVYVLDWGVAHVMERSDLYRGLDLPRIPIAGTPQYMSPEQLEGTVGPSVDVYAVGAILFEVLVGMRAFDETTNMRSLRSRKPAPLPSEAAKSRKVPAAFDALVGACLAPRPEDRPTARTIADAIDAFLDGERERLEREREATTLCEEGEAVVEEHARLTEEAQVLETKARSILASLAPHDAIEPKLEGWAIADGAMKLKAEAARALALAEIAFSSALGRSRDHQRARRGLARLHLTQLLDAEQAGDMERMAKHLEVARSYDDGTLRHELSDRGELEVTCDRDIVVEVFRYERSGPLLVLGARHELGHTPTGSRLLPTGSYLVVARSGEREVRYPILLSRAFVHRLTLRFPSSDELPPSMALVAGGPFLAASAADGLETRRLPDFALATYPVTLGEYATWLDSMGEDEAARHLPHDGVAPLLKREGGAWRIADSVVSANGRTLVPAERAHELPVYGVTWFDATAYARWRGSRDGRAYRLPTALEWEKAMRGADGRPFPMGMKLDPSFAKIRQSRAEGPVLEPVGTFGLDASPYAVRDLGGGVGDWTSTLVEDAGGSAEDAGADSDQRQAFWMGGHWGSMGAQSASSRIPMGIRYRSNGVGFRLALSPDAGASSDLVVEPMR